MKPFPQLLALSLLAGAATAQAADPKLARNLAATCANCHGTDGRSAPGTDMEQLAGRNKARTLEKLMGYKAGKRDGTIMPQIAKGYSDEQLELIVGYFSALPVEEKP